MSLVQEEPRYALKTIENKSFEPLAWEKASEDYAQAVEAHVRQKSSQSLLPHPNFQWFAIFLQGRKEPPSYTVSIEEDHHVFGIIHDYMPTRRYGSRITDISGQWQLQQLVAHPRPQTGTGQLIFLRGFPTHDWLKVVGSQHGIDPEFFRRHMEFRIPTEKFFDLPGLPSSDDNLLRLSITTVGLHTPTTSSKARGTGDLKKHWEATKTRNVVGESIVRRFSWHFDRYFSIEQHLSICVVPKHEGGWICKLIIKSHGLNLN
jgi:hypothetical protein